jgi:tetratricopeptide (TPR) repeat protein
MVESWAMQVLFKTLPFFTVVGLLFFLQKIQSYPESQWRILTPPPPHIEKMSFGFSDVMADSLWLLYIQDLGECEILGRRKLWEQRKCDRGWSFLMLDAITNLAPRNWMPYATGAITLSVLNGDVEGAHKIFEKALRNFPNDWIILYRASYHYLEDMKDKKGAAELMARASAAGAPPWLKSLASRLYSESGEIDLALSNLKSYRDGLTDPKLALQVDRRIAELEAKKAALTNP